MSETKDKEKKTIADKISAWITKYRFVLFGLIGVAIVAVIVVALTTGLSESVRKNALNELDSIVYPLTQSSDEDLKAVQDESLPKLQQLAEKNADNVAGARAYMVIAEIYFNRQEWASAAQAWQNAASSDIDAYTAPICYYNAAACYEELSDLPNAIALYEKALADENCMFVPHVLFTLGRVNEEAGNYSVAVEKYNKLTSEYPSDDWANLAKSRLIQLSIDGKI